MGNLKTNIYVPIELGTVGLIRSINSSGSALLLASESTLWIWHLRDLIGGPAQRDIRRSFYLAVSLSEIGSASDVDPFKRNYLALVQQKVFLIKVPESPPATGRFNYPYELVASCHSPDHIQLLSRTFDSAACILEWRGNSFSLGGLHQEGQTKFRVPDHLARWKPRSVAVTPADVYLILNDYSHGQVVVFGRESCELRAHYVQGVANSQRSRLHSLQIDSKQRVYSRWGDRLTMLAETGDLEPDWFCCGGLLV